MSDSFPKVVLRRGAISSRRLESLAKRFKLGPGDEIAIQYKNSFGNKEESVLKRPQDGDGWEISKPGREIG